MKVRLTTKLMIMYMLLLMSIVIGVGGYYVAGNLGRIRDESISTTSQFADRIMEQVDLRLKNMDQMAVDLFSDPEFRQAAQQWADGSAADVETSIRQILNRHSPPNPTSATQYYIRRLKEVMAQAGADL